MAALTADETSRLLDACEQLLHERAQIVELLADLPSSWSRARTVVGDGRKLRGVAGRKVRGVVAC